MTADWFRTPAWDARTSEDFERRLARARPDNRPQYIRIKALALAGAGQEGAARALLERVVRDYSGSLDCRASIEHLADLSRKRGDLAIAERGYRQLLARWPDLSATSGMAEVSLAEVLLDRGGQAEAHEALQLLNSVMARGRVLAFDADLFRWHIALIKAAEAVGEHKTVKKAAATALRLAERGPKFPRHPTVGVVATDPGTLTWLRDRAS